MTIEEKMSIARGMVTPLLRKIGAGTIERYHLPKAPFFCF